MEPVPQLGDYSLLSSDTDHKLDPDLRAVVTREYRTSSSSAIDKSRYPDSFPSSRQMKTETFLKRQYWGLVVGLQLLILLILLLPNRQMRSKEGSSSVLRRSRLVMILTVCINQVSAKFLCGTLPQFLAMRCAIYNVLMVYMECLRKVIDNLSHWS